MITNKDLSIDSKNGQVILNGDKYDLGTQGEIDAAVKDVYSVMGQNGAKNLIPYPYYETTKEINDVVVTDNGDGTLTFNGTASANTTVFKYLNNDAAIKIPLERRKYKLTFGTDQGTSGFHLGDYRIVKTDNTTQTVNVTGDTIIDNTNGDYLGINAMSVYVAKNKALNNVTIYPMLRLAADTDNTYQPYAKTNRQLTEVIGDLSGTGVTGNSVAAQIASLEGSALKVVNVSSTMTVSTQDADAIGGYRSVSQTSKALSTFTGYPTGKVVVADSLHAYGANAATAAVVNVINGVVYLNAAKAGDYTVEGVVFYHD